METSQDPCGQGGGSGGEAASGARAGILGCDGLGPGHSRDLHPACGTSAHPRGTQASELQRLLPKTEFKAALDLEVQKQKERNQTGYINYQIISSTLQVRDHFYPSERRITHRCSLHCSLVIQCEHKMDTSNIIINPKRLRWEEKNWKGKAIPRQCQL